MCIKRIKYYDIKSGKVVSCGCYQKEQASKTGSTTGLNNYKNNYCWYFIKNGEKIMCRSGYEVIYANYLIQNNINFQYEPKCFKLDLPPVALRIFSERLPTATITR